MIRYRQLSNSKKEKAVFEAYSSCVFVSANLELPINTLSIDVLAETARNLQSLILIFLSRLIMWVYYLTFIHSHPHIRLAVLPPFSTTAFLPHRE